MKGPEDSGVGEPSCQHFSSYHEGEQRNLASHFLGSEVGWGLWRVFQKDVPCSEPDLEGTELGRDMAGLGKV